METIHRNPMSSSLCSGYGGGLPSSPLGVPSTNSPTTTNSPLISAQHAWSNQSLLGANGSELVGPAGFDDQNTSFDSLLNPAEHSSHLMFGGHDAFQASDSYYFGTQFHRPSFDFPINDHSAGITDFQLAASLTAAGNGTSISTFLGNDHTPEIVLRSPLHHQTQHTSSSSRTSISLLDDHSSSEDIHDGSSSTSSLLPSSSSSSSSCSSSNSPFSELVTHQPSLPVINTPMISTASPGVNSDCLCDNNNQNQVTTTHTSLCHHLPSSDFSAVPNSDSASSKGSHRRSSRRQHRSLSRRRHKSSSGRNSSKKGNSQENCSYDSECPTSTKHRRHRPHSRRSRSPRSSSAGLPSSLHHSTPRRGLLVSGGSMNHSTSTLRGGPSMYGTRSFASHHVASGGYYEPMSGALTPSQQLLPELYTFPYSTTYSTSSYLLATPASGLSHVDFSSSCAYGDSTNGYCLVDPVGSYQPDCRNKVPGSSFPAITAGIAIPQQPGYASSSPPTDHTQIDNSSARATKKQRVSLSTNAESCASIESSTGLLKSKNPQTAGNVIGEPQRDFLQWSSPINSLPLVVGSAGGITSSSAAISSSSPPSSSGMSENPSSISSITEPNTVVAAATSIQTMDDDDDVVFERCVTARSQLALTDTQSFHEVSGHIEQDSLSQAQPSPKSILSQPHGVVSQSFQNNWDSSSVSELDVATLYPKQKETSTNGSCQSSSCHLSNNTPSASYHSGVTGDSATSADSISCIIPSTCNWGSYSKDVAASSPGSSAVGSLTVVGSALICSSLLRYHIPTSYQSGTNSPSPNDKGQQWPPKQPAAVSVGVDVSTLRSATPLYATSNPVTEKSRLSLPQLPSPPLQPLFEITPSPPQIGIQKLGTVSTSRLVQSSIHTERSVLPPPAIVLSCAPSGPSSLMSSPQSYIATPVPAVAQSSPPSTEVSLDHEGPGHLKRKRSREIKKESREAKVQKISEEDNREETKELSVGSTNTEAASDEPFSPSLSLEGDTTLKDPGSFGPRDEQPEPLATSSTNSKSSCDKTLDGSVTEVLGLGLISVFDGLFNEEHKVKRRHLEVLVSRFLPTTVDFEDRDSGEATMELHVQTSLLERLLGGALDVYQCSWTELLKSQVETMKTMRQRTTFMSEITSTLLHCTSALCAALDHFISDWLFQLRLQSEILSIQAAKKTIYSKIVEHYLKPDVAARREYRVQTVEALFKALPSVIEEERKNRSCKGRKERDNNSSSEDMDSPSTFTETPISVDYGLPEKDENKNLEFSSNVKENSGCQPSHNNQVKCETTDRGEHSCELSQSNDETEQNHLRRAAPRTRQLSRLASTAEIDKTSTDKTSDIWTPIRRITRSTSKEDSSRSSLKKSVTHPSTHKDINQTKTPKRSISKSPTFSPQKSSSRSLPFSKKISSHPLNEAAGSWTASPTASCIPSTDHRCQQFHVLSRDVTISS